MTYGRSTDNTSPNDPDSDNDGLPDGWEWMLIDPSSFGDGAVGDPDGDGMSNLQEYTYLPSGWDIATTLPCWHGGGTAPCPPTIGPRNTPCSSTRRARRDRRDGTGSVILCDEDPVGNICTDGFTTRRTALWTRGQRRRRRRGLSATTTTVTAHR